MPIKDYIMDSMCDSRLRNARSNGIWHKCKFIACCEGTNLMRGFAFNILGKNNTLIEIHGLDTTEKIDAVIQQLNVLKKDIAEFDALPEEEKKTYWEDQ